MKKNLTLIIGSIMLASVAVLYATHVLDASKTAYMKCVPIEYSDDPWFIEIFRYQRTIFGEIKVTQWGSGLGWLNFCTPTNETECDLQEGFARRLVKAPTESDTKNADRYILDFHRTFYEKLDGSRDEYHCTFVKDHPLFR